MADEGEVSALVCDNGSGMVKVRTRSRGPTRAPRRLFLRKVCQRAGFGAPNGWVGSTCAL